MIVIRIELWPNGKEKGKRELGRLEIENDGSGTADLGNYDCAATVIPGVVRRACRVERFNRKRRNSWDLAFVALRGLVGGRNP